MILITERSRRVMFVVGIVAVVVVMANIVGFGVAGRDYALLRIRNTTQWLAYMGEAHDSIARRVDNNTLGIKYLEAHNTATILARKAMIHATSKLVVDVLTLNASLLGGVNASVEADKKHIILKTDIREGMLRGAERTTAVNTTLHAHLGADTVGEVRMFYTDRGCPEGWREVPMRGYVLVSRPNGSRAGTTHNRPLTANERGRVGSHGHAVVVSDPGHTHSTGIFGEGNNKAGPHAQANADTVEHNTATAKTGVTVKVLNSTGEDLPLMHILMCTV
jgi:hypothetical protein